MNCHGVVLLLLHRSQAVSRSVRSMSRKRFCLGSKFEAECIRYCNAIFTPTACRTLWTVSVECRRVSKGRFSRKLYHHRISTTGCLLGHLSHASDLSLHMQEIRKTLANIQQGLDAYILTLIFQASRMHHANKGWCRHQSDRCRAIFPGRPNPHHDKPYAATRGFAMATGP